jgi:hypothetical protein
MRQPPFIWLGSGRTRKHDVAYKGRMLDLAARGGLPVPQGGILLDDFFRICLAENIIELVGDEVVIADPVWLAEVLYRDIRFPRLKENVAVRLATAESASSSTGGSFTQLDVDFNDPQQIATALRQVWSAAGPRSEGQRMDLLVMAMIAIRTGGIAISRQESADDQTTLNGDLTDGTRNSLLLPRPRIFRRSPMELPPYARRLQKLLAGVRRTFGHGDYAIEWADDEDICWLIQIL